MRWIAMLPSIALVAGCLREETVDCGNGFLCPVGLACAAPGYCGDPAQVTSCSGVADWDPCAFDGSDPKTGSCRHGICGACNGLRQGCGTGWHPISAPTTFDLLEVFAFARDDVYVAGRSGSLFHYDGVTWTAVATTPELPSGTGKDVLSLWGSSSADLWVVMTAGLYRIRDRIAMEHYATLGTEVLGIWGTAADNIYGSGKAGTIRRFDGADWQVIHMNGAFALHFVGAASSTRVIAAGSLGGFESLAGSMWTSGTVDAGGKAIQGIWVGETEAFVFGDDRTLKRFNGTTWDPVSFDLSFTVTPHFYGAWGLAAQHYAVGFEGRLVRSTNGTDWADASPGLGTNTLFGIHGLADGNMFVVGSSGAVWQFSPPL